jgi:glycosyltransferase domain-containing protein
MFQKNRVLKVEDKAPSVPRLSIVLPLRGRHLFTLRFLWHANKARLPYRFVIPDGQVHSELARLLEDPGKIFPKLAIEYVRYPDDVNFGRYFIKMLDAIQRVRTPYVMFADNDDFLASTGIEASLDFLERNPDYVCCGGGIAGFSAHSTKNLASVGLIGPLNQLSFRYMPYDRSTDLSSSSVTDRLLRGLRNSWSWYAVFRTPALMTIRREVVEMSLSDLQLHEKFCAMRTLTLGKARSDAAMIAYLRQYWTSLQYSYAKDWVHHLIRSRFNTDFVNIMDRICELAAAADSLERSVVSEKLLNEYAPWFTQFLKRNYGPVATLRRHIRTTAPGMLTWLKMRRRFSILFERRAVLSKLRKNGASESYIKAFANELAEIEDVLIGKEFRDFIMPFAGKFAADMPGKVVWEPAARFDTLSPRQNV